MKPRPYQEKGIKKIFSSWSKGYREVMLVMPTGGGKTVTFVDIIRKFIANGKSVMLVAHREELINQAHATLYKRQIYAGIIKADIKPQYHLPCQVASIQTIQRRKKLPPADLVIFDEAHHVQSDNNYGSVIKKHFKTSFILGVTATPYRLSGKGFTDIFKRLIETVTFNDLVKMGYLTPYKYFVGSMPDLSGARIVQGDYVNEDVKKAMELAPLVESYEEHCLGKQGIVFCVNIQHSIEVCEKYQAAGYPAAHIDGSTHPETRKRIIKRFRDGEIKVMCNVGIATEGTDFPECEFVQLARPTMSLSLFLQMVGRSCRTIFDEIKDCSTDDERRLAVQNGKKPSAIILDNAGAWKHHGLPDQEFDWKKYFEGIGKKKKDNPNIIEIIEYIAEDDSGRRVVAKTPDEIEGMVLIEVNKHEKVRERVVNIKSLKEFDKQKFIVHNQYKKGIVKKPGWSMFYRYKEYCEKNFIEMNEAVWNYLFEQLVEKRREKIQELRKLMDEQIDKLSQKHTEKMQQGEIPFDVANSDYLAERKQIQDLYEEKIKVCNLYGVPSYALEKEKKKYFQQLKSA